MFIVSRTFIAINILRYLAAHEGTVVSSTAMAEDISVPRPYTRKVANQLIRAGMIRSVRGYSGGLILARPASAIRLGDVLDVVEETRVGRRELPPDLEQISEAIDEARLKFLEVLNEHSIADFQAHPRHSCEAKRLQSDALGMMPA